MPSISATTPPVLSAIMKRGSTSARATSEPRSLIDVLVGRQADVVANANGRHENAQLQRGLLAQQRDALEQVAALAFVDRAE